MRRLLTILLGLSAGLPAAAAAQAAARITFDGRPGFGPRVTC